MPGGRVVDGDEVLQPHQNHNATSPCDNLALSVCFSSSRHHFALMKCKARHRQLIALSKSPKLKYAPGGAPMEAEVFLSLAVVDAVYWHMYALRK
jgi:hypothetical protein